ncbi:MAG: hypothetical protein U1E85_11330 [Rhodocyclaceae bacterium]
MAKKKPHMSYEEHLDEVTTQITEIYTVEDDEAIRMVMAAQEDEYFSGHDDDPTICTLERAGVDARHVFKNYSQKARARKSAKAN